MDPLFQDERISAYLDNELSADERSQFEDELARNGELRQIVEELRSLHDSLQILPRRRLEEDFAQHVLRRAEREMLTDSRAAANGAAGAVAHTAASGSNSISDVRKSRRPWIWAAVAIAAAIALMVFNPQPKREVRIAQVDSNAQPRVESQKKSNESRRKEQISATPADQERSLRKRTDGLADKKIAGDGEAGQAPSSFAKAAAAPRGEAFDRLAVSSSEKSIDGSAGSKTVRQADPGFRRNALQTSTSPSNRPIENAAEGKPQLFTASTDRAAAAKSDSADARQLVEGTRRSGSEGGKGHAKLPASRSLSFGSSQQHGKESLRAGDMYVAEYATSSIDTLQRLLDKRGITLNNSPAAMLTAMVAVRNVSAGNVAADKLLLGSVAGSSVARGNGPAGSGTSSVPGDGIQSGGKSNLAGDNADRPTASPVPGSKAPGRARAPATEAPVADAAISPQVPAASEEPLEVVYVVGSRQQVMGLIDDLHAQPAEYRALAIGTVSRSTAEELEQDAKARNGQLQLLATDEGGQGASDFKRDGQLRTPMIHNQSQSTAPAAPQPVLLAPAAPPPALAAGPTAADKNLPAKSGKGPVTSSAGLASGGAVPPNTNKGAANKDSANKEIAKDEGAALEAAQKEIKQSPANKPGAAGLGGAGPSGAESTVAEQQAAAPAAPAAVPDITSAASDADLAEPSERAGGTAWAARMTSLAPDTEHVLRQALARNEKQPAYRAEQLRQPTDDVARDDSAVPNREKDSDKAKAAEQLKSAEGNGALAAQLDGAAAGDQVQAVFVFRLMPAKANPTKAAAPAKTAK